MDIAGVLFEHQNAFKCSCPFQHFFFFFLSIKVREMFLNNMFPTSVLQCSKLEIESKAFQKV